MPTSSPALAGYVYVMDRKKKWTKRWLELREHSLFHAKSASGKNEEPIAHMSNFDIYLVQPGTIKSPKAHCFALRSQDSIRLFEKPDQDYVHFFCLSDAAAHRDWVKNILNARTYVLRQERAALFHIPSAYATPAHEAGGLSRASTLARAARHLEKSSSQMSSSEVGHGAGAAAGSAAVGDTSSSRLLHHPAPLISAAQQPEAYRGPFEKGSLLADVAMKAAAAGMAQSGDAVDLSMHERTRQRLEATNRNAERQRQTRMAIAAGRPLLQAPTQ